MESFPKWVQQEKIVPPEVVLKKLEEVLLKLNSNSEETNLFIEALTACVFTYHSDDYQNSILKNEASEISKKIDDIYSNAKQLLSLLAPPTPRHILRVLEESLDGHEAILNKDVLKKMSASGNVQLFNILKNSLTSSGSDIDESARATLQEWFATITPEEAQLNEWHEEFFSLFDNSIPGFLKMMRVNSSPYNVRLEAFRFQINGFVEALEQNPQIKGHLEKAKKPGKKSGKVGGNIDKARHKFINSVGLALEIYTGRLPSSPEFQKIVRILMGRNTDFADRQIKAWIHNQDKNNKMAENDT